MIYQAEGLLLSQVREILRGPSNDVVVCRDLALENGRWYTVLPIRDRNCAKKVLAAFENTEKTSAGGSPHQVCTFAQGEELCFVFEYRPERRLSLFAQGQLHTQREREEAGINLVMECLSTRLPYPLLYLVLEQDNVHIEKDNGVYFSPFLDLSRLDLGITERDCARRCVELVLPLLQGTGARRAKSFELLHKKIGNNAYQSLPEVYRDIKVTAEPAKKRSLRQNLKLLWLEHRDRLFRVLLVLCVLAAAVALVVLISQLLFGDVPLFRLFERRFERIGTRSLA